MKPVIITIRTNPKWNPWQAVYVVALWVGVISIGVAIDSAAMQWAGFTALMLIGLGVAVVRAAQTNGITIEQARAQIDKLAANERS